MWCQRSWEHGRQEQNRPAIQGLKTPGVKEINPEFSTGRMTTRDEIDRVVEVTAAAVKRLRG